MLKEKNLIITEESLDKVCEIIYGLEQDGFDKMIQSLIKEQEPLASLCFAFQENKDEDYFLDFITYVLVIWQSYKLQMKKLPVISIESIEKAGSIIEKAVEELSKELKIDEKELMLKLDEINEGINEYVNRGDEPDAYFDSLDADQALNAKKMLERIHNVRQPEILDFLLEMLEEEDDTNEEDDESKGQMLGQLMTIVNAFDIELEKSHLSL